MESTSDIAHSAVMCSLRGPISPGTVAVARAVEGVEVGLKSSSWRPHKNRRRESPLKKGTQFTGVQSSPKKWTVIIHIFILMNPRSETKNVKNCQKKISFIDWPKRDFNIKTLHTCTNIIHFLVKRTYVAFTGFCKNEYLNSCAVISGQ